VLLDATHTLASRWVLLGKRSVENGAAALEAIIAAINLSYQP